MHIVVIGAGIVGLTTAWYLRQEGHRVTLVERAPTVGMGASHANGGQLSYRYVAPLADPDVLEKLPGWMLQRDAPVRFRPRFDPQQWRWLLRFLKACNRHDKARSIASLLPLALHSRALTHELVDTHGLAFDFVRNGKLVVHRDARSFEEARRLLESAPELTAAQQALDGEACIALEPALARLRGRIVGGIHTPAEDAGDCLKLCRALAARMTGAPNPVKFAFGREVHGFARSGSRITAVITDAGAIDCEACVLATGAAASALLRPLGVDVPIYPVKGYSISVPIRAGANAPAISVTDFQRKVVYARLGSQLRVAGMADIVGHDSRISRDRITALLAETGNCFGDGFDFGAATPWAGLRPATPTGRPIIDRAGADNLWLNLGHGALGFTLAAGSAQLLADRIAGREPACPDEDFRVEAPSSRSRRSACTTVLQTPSSQPRSLRAPVAPSPSARPRPAGSGCGRAAARSGPARTPSSRAPAGSRPSAAGAADGDRT